MQTFGCKILPSPYSKLQRQILVQTKLSLKKILVTQPREAPSCQTSQTHSLLPCPSLFGVILRPEALFPSKLTHRTQILIPAHHIPPKRALREMAPIPSLLHSHSRPQHIIRPRRVHSN
jgi:hypothetical protein